MRRASFQKNRNFYAAVGQRIAKARNGRLTQEMLGTKTGMTRTSIINIEKGRQQVLLHTIRDIAGALQIPVNDLIPELDNLDLILKDQPATMVEWVRGAAQPVRTKGK